MVICYSAAHPVPLEKETQINQPSFLPLANSFLFRLLRVSRFLTGPVRSYGIVEKTVLVYRRSCSFDDLLPHEYDIRITNTQESLVPFAGCNGHEATLN